VERLATADDGEDMNIPYGFRLAADGSLEEAADEQAVIARVRELNERGLPLRGIASMLDLEGFKTRRGTAFTHIQVSNMLGRTPTPKAETTTRSALDVVGQRARTMAAIRKGGRQ
jgi:hypothetical protein